MIALECAEALVEVERGGVRMGLRAEPFAGAAHHALAPPLHLGLAERAAGAKEPAPLFNRLLRPRRMLMARDRLLHTDAVALGVGERDIWPHTGDLHRLAEHRSARLCDSPDRVFDIFHRNHDGWVLRRPIGLFREAGFSDT
jgi:hypothetical protein